MAAPKALNHNFFSGWSSPMAYVLGFFAADGSMMKHKRGGHYIEFQITDRVILEHIQRTTGSSHTIARRPSKNERHKALYRIQFGSKQWFADLTRLGFTPSKSKTLRMPLVPDALWGDFIRGYFDGDGCVYFKRLQFADRKKKRWILMTLFTSGSLSFLQNLFSVLKEHNVKGGSLKQKERGYELVFSRRDSFALYELMYHTNPVEDLFLPRKRRLLEVALKTLQMRT